MKANAALKINYVEISNFKSFKGTVKVGPFQNLTTIVGPNGGGKSNIVDAIVFALGLNPHEMKHKAEDLICKSKESPDDITSVAIIFQEGTELESIKRELKGTTNSYYINEKKVPNHQEYISKLSVFNINPKRGLFVIRQGEIYSIAQQSAVELPYLIERISGSGDYKAKYEEHQKKIDELNKIKSEVNSSLKELKEQAKRTKDIDQRKEDYQKILNLEKENTIALYANRAALLDKIAIDNKEILGTMKEKIVAREEAYESLREKYKGAEKELRAQTRECLKVETEMQNMKSELTELNLQETSLQDKTSNSLKTIESLQLILSNHKKENEERRMAIESLEKNITELKGQIQLLENEKEALNQSELNLSEAMQGQYYEAKSQVAVETKELQQCLVSLNTNHEYHLNKIKELTRQKEEIIKQIDTKENDQKLSKAIIEKEEDTQNHLQDDCKAKEKEYDKCKLLKENTIKEKEGIDSTVQKIKLKLSELNEHFLLYKKGINERIALDDLKKRSKGVYGLVQEYIELTNEEYSIAVKGVLSNFLDTIIVQSKEDEILCNNYFQEKEMARSVVVLDNIANISVGNKADKVKDIDYLEDVIESKGCTFAKELDALLKHKCKGIVIADDIKSAFKLSKTHKHIVTRKGEILKNGIIKMGCETHLQKIELVNDFEKEIEKNSKKLEITQKSLFGINIEEIEKQCKTANMEFQTAQAALADSTAKIKSEKRSIDSSKDDISELNKELGKVLSPLSVSNKEKGKIAEKMEEINSKIESIEHKYYKDILKKLGYKSIKELEGRNMSEFMQLMDKITNLTQTFDNYTNKLEELKMKEGHNMHQLEVQIHNQEDIKEELLNQANKVQQIKASRQKQYDAQVALMEKSTASKKECMNQLNDYKKKLDDSLNFIQESKFACMKAEKENESLDSKKQDIANEIRINSIDIDIDITKPHLIDYNKHSIKFKEATRKDIEQQVSNIHDDLERVLEKKAKFNTLALHVTNPNKADLDTDIKNKQAELEKINDELKEVQDQFNRVKNDRNALFMEYFEKIKINLENIYKSLTACVVNDVESSGLVTFTCSQIDEPYLGKINYIPVPSKRPASYNVNQLSYGEKSIAAIALAFAIQKCCKSPFLILDEVDANLDVKNVKTIANDLTKLSNDTDTQIICISHNEDIQIISECLFGIAQSADVKSSVVFSLDLRNIEN